MNKQKKLTYILITIFLLINISAIPQGCNEVQEAEKFKTVRKFVAEIIYPPPQVQASRKNPVKSACLNNLQAIQIISSNPDIIKQDPFVSLMLENGHFDFSAFRNAPISTVSSYLNRISDEKFQELTNNIDTAISKFDFNTIHALKNLESIKLPKLGESWETFLKNILINYFPSLKPEDKKRIFASLLNHTLPNSSNADILVALISGSGPFFQKYIQLFSDNIDAANNEELEELKSKLNTVKSGLPPIDLYYINRYIEQIKHESNVQIEIIKSLGAASIGETYLAAFTNAKGVKTQTPIVVKLMRPGVEEIAQREVHFFRDTAKSISQNMVLSFQGLEKQIFEEMDYAEELKRLELGYQAYNDPNSIVKVVAPIKDFPQGKYWMAMELAPWKNISGSSQFK